jgi:hypothetical protein
VDGSGATLPVDDVVDRGLVATAIIEALLGSRLSARGEAGIGSVGDGQRFGNRIGLWLFDLNFVYGVPYGAWRPYVTGGLGLARYRKTISGPTLDPALRDSLIGLGLDPAIKRSRSVTTRLEAT